MTLILIKSDMAFGKPTLSVYFPKFKTDLFVVCFAFKTCWSAEPQNHLILPDECLRERILLFS